MDKFKNYLQGFTRSTFGLENIKGGRHVIHWRLTDILFVALLTVLYPIVNDLQPFQRQFYINDLTISHPFAEHERVTSDELFWYAAWIPLLAIAVLSLVITKPKNKLYVTYVSVLGICISTLTSSIITGVLKNAFGRHRPDFLARCIPKADAPKDIMVLAKDVCTTDNIDRLMDGFRTTPLGHSSIAFGGLLYLLFWLLGQLTVTRPQTGAWRSALAFLPTLGAMLIALSRTEDYRHHFIDVFVGLVLGAVIATWLYFRLFPSFGALRCYEPRLLIDQEEIAPDSGYLPVEEV